MEEMHLAAETDEASRERLAALREDLAAKREQLSNLNARWQAEKTGLNRVGELKAQLDEARTQAERRAAQEAEIATTKVEFFTLVRGED